MPRVADTSFLFALFDEGDANHLRAIRELENPDPVVVPSEIAVEVANLIRYRHGYEAARQAIAFLFGRPHVRVAPSVELDAVRRTFEAAGGKLSLADAVVVQSCRALALPALSYDQNIDRALAD